MAKNITLLGASYSDVPAVNLPQTGGGTARFDDVSVTTATASDVAQGKVFVASDGTITTGTSSGGGSSSWTKIAETTVTASHTGTSSTTVLQFETGHSEIWTSDKIVYVRIRDTVGKRNGYFYGTDTFFMNMYPKNGSTTASASMGILTQIWSYTTSGVFSNRHGYSTTGYGVYVDQIGRSGTIRIRARYNSSYSLIIDSIYKIEVYLLDPADGVPIFE